MAALDYQSNIALMNYTIESGKNALPISRQELAKNPNAIVNLILDEWGFSQIGANATLPLTPISEDDTLNQYTTLYLDNWDTSFGGYFTKQNWLSDDERIMQLVMSYPGIISPSSKGYDKHFSIFKHLSVAMASRFQQVNTQYNFLGMLNNHTSASAAGFFLNHDEL